MYKIISPISQIVRGFIFQGLQMDEFILYGTRKTHAHMIFNNRVLGKDRRKCVMVQNGQQVSSVTRTTFHCHSGYSLLLDCLALMLPPKEESQEFSGYYHPVLSSFLGHNLQQSSFKAVDFLYCSSVHDCLWLGNPSLVQSLELLQQGWFSPQIWQDHSKFEQMTVGWASISEEEGSGNFRTAYSDNSVFQFLPPVETLKVLPKWKEFISQYSILPYSTYFGQNVLC